MENLEEKLLRETYETIEFRENCNILAKGIMNLENEENMIQSKLIDNREYITKLSIKDTIKLPLNAIYIRKLNIVKFLTTIKLYITKKIQEYRHYRDEKKYELNIHRKKGTKLNKEKTINKMVEGKIKLEKYALETKANGESKRNKEENKVTLLNGSDLDR